MAMAVNIDAIVYASDASKGSRIAFEAAINQAVKHQATIIYVHAVSKNDVVTPDISYSYLPSDIEKLHSAQHRNELIEKLKARIHRYIEEKLSHLDIEVQFSICVQFGNPEVVILNTANRFNAGLIVMGNRKTSELSRVFLGSTANKVLHKSEVPVLIVPITNK
jgi:nucleotide-binding universal stress UspA family protein